MRAAPPSAPTTPRPPAGPVVPARPELAAAPGEPMLSVQDVTFTYLGQAAPTLSGVSFTLGRREVLGVLGPVGAGKTTLCLCLAGLMPRVFGGSLSGEIRVAGLDPRRARGHDIARHLGIVFEDYSAQLTQVRVGDEVAAPLENRGVPPDEARARGRGLLARLGLDAPGLDRKRTWELSGGQQQRVAIAAALATEPEILILDNVTAMLDPAGKDEVRRVLAELAGEATLVVVDSDPGMLAAVADRVLVLAGGRVATHGPAREVLGDRAALEASGVMVPAPLRAARLLDLPGSPLTEQEFRQAAAAVYPVVVPPGRPDPVGTPGGPAGPGPEPGPLAVDAAGVGYRYPDGTAALDQVSMRVGAGEVHGLLGGNGAGKTTLAKVLVGLAKPGTGSVTVAGRDAAATRAVDLATSVGTAFQKPDEQLSERTVRDEIAFGLRARRYQRTGWFARRECYSDETIAARVSWACDLAGIEESLLDCDPSTLPFGQRKLVTLAAAIVLDPPVVVLDEPGTGLDAAAHRTVEAMVGRLAAMGKAVVLVEHEIDLVGELTDTVTILDRGAVATQGPTRAVFARGNWDQLRALHIVPPWPARLAATLGLDALTYADLAAARDHLPAGR